MVPDSTDTEIVFAANQGVNQRTITTNDTDDQTDATVIISLGTLPSPLVHGSPSSVTITVADNDGPPSEPADLQADSAGSGEVTITWGAASSESSPITAYQVRVRRSDRSNWAPNWTDVPGGAGVRDATLGPFTNGASHIFQVRAINATGNGAVAETTFTPFGPPGQPTVNTSPRNEALSVTWSITDDGGQPTDKYQIQWKTSGQEFSSNVRNRTLDDREYTITGLDNGTTYQVRVRASNDGGTVYGD